jgi:hypothetical protein
MAVYIFIAIFIAIIVVGGIWGADSRPNFRDGRTNYKERYFFHSRRD